METKFKTAFILDKDGIPRRWNIPIEQIKSLWQSAKLNSEKLVDLFCAIRLSDDERKVKFFTTTPDKQFELSPVDDHLPIKEENLVLQQNEARDILSRFRNSVTGAYTSAMQARDSIVSQGTIPWYILGLLLLLGSNEIIWVFQLLLFNPVTLIFFALFAGALFYAWQNNLLPIVSTLVMPVFNQVKAKAGDFVWNMAQPPPARASHHYAPGTEPRPHGSNRSKGSVTSDESSGPESESKQKED